MEQFGEILISALLVIGGVFGVVGSYGLVKLPDPMTRLHGPTKAATLGVGGVLCASLMWFAFFSDQASWHEVLIIVFIFLTAPITGLMIAKAHIHRSWQCSELPSAAPDENWATCAPDKSKPESRNERPAG